MFYVHVFIEKKTEFCSPLTYDIMKYLNLKNQLF